MYPFAIKQGHSRLPLFQHISAVAAFFKNYCSAQFIFKKR
jgi:hypothetical protein